MKACWTKQNTCYKHNAFPVAFQGLVRFAALIGFNDSHLASLWDLVSTAQAPFSPMARWPLDDWRKHKDGYMKSRNHGSQMNSGCPLLGGQAWEIVMGMNYAYSKKRINYKANEKKLMLRFRQAGKGNGGTVWMGGRANGEGLSLTGATSISSSAKWLILCLSLSTYTMH